MRKKLTLHVTNNEVVKKYPGHVDFLAALVFLFFILHKITFGVSKVAGSKNITTTPTVNFMANIPSCLCMVAYHQALCRSCFREYYRYYSR